MANSVLTYQSTLTDRFQTTVPDSVRRALHLKKREKIQYNIQASGQVLMSRADQQQEEDPVLDQFLSFLADDMTRNPQNLHAISSEWMEKVQSLLPEVDIDLNQVLSEEGE